MWYFVQSSAFGNVYLILYLKMNVGASLNTMSNLGRTVLDVAEEKGNSEMATLLKRSGIPRMYRYIQSVNHNIHHQKH